MVVPKDLKASHTFLPVVDIHSAECALREAAAPHFLWSPRGYSLRSLRLSHLHEMVCILADLRQLYHRSLLQPCLDEMIYLAVDLDSPALCSCRPARFDVTACMIGSLEGSSHHAALEAYLERMVCKMSNWSSSSFVIRSERTTLFGWLQVVDIVYKSSLGGEIE